MADTPGLGCLAPLFGDLARHLGRITMYRFDLGRREMVLKVHRGSFARRRGGQRVGKAGSDAHKLIDARGVVGEGLLQGGGCLRAKFKAACRLCHGIDGLTAEPPQLSTQLFGVHVGYGKLAGHIARCRKVGGRKTGIDHRWRGGLRGDTGAARFHHLNEVQHNVAAFQVIANERARYVAVTPVSAMCLKSRRVSPRVIEGCKRDNLLKTEDRLPHLGHLLKVRKNMRDMRANVRHDAHVPSCPRLKAIRDRRVENTRVNPVQGLGRNDRGGSVGRIIEAAEGGLELGPGIAPGSVERMRQDIVVAVVGAETGIPKPGFSVAQLKLFKKSLDAGAAGLFIADVKDH